MAPSPSRRPGYSRRAQYGTFFGYAAGVFGAVAGAVLLVVSTLNPSAFASVRGYAASAVQPAGGASAVSRGVGQDVLSLAKGFLLAGSRDARLERELRQATTRLAEAQATAEENRRLKALLGLARTQPRPVAIARLTGSSGASTRRFAIIDAGRANGVGIGMPVRSPLGLIGRVLELGPSSARVLLVSDAGSLVPVRRASDGVPAFAQGRGDGTLQLRLINLGVNPLRRGDIFVTSGSGGLYRPGTAVAVAAALTRDGAIAHVLSDPAATDYVVVDPVWNPAVLAASPPAAADPAAKP